MGIYICVCTNKIERKIGNIGNRHTSTLCGCKAELGYLSFKKQVTYR